jgi:ornithine cyclodeaminase/alanine dehydrogenase-like protein (mu-crystallin family)
VVGAGSNHWYTREVDGKVIEHADLVVVDHKEQSRAGSGNILWAVSHGIITWDQIKEFGDIVTGCVPLPDLKNATILFGSHGLGITDTAIAARTYELVKARGLGTAITL